MNKIKKILLLALALCVFTFSTVNADTQLVVTDFTMDDTGYGEIIGYLPSAGYELTLLICKNVPVEKITETDILYIDQMTSGQNGAFLFEFYINSKWAGTDYLLIMGSNYPGFETYQRTGTIGIMPALVNRVKNNALRVGNDVYDIDSSLYTSKNIANSIKTGGNCIYYKIGGAWYDLLDPDATSSAFLITDNALPSSETDRWILSNYYTVGVQAFGGAE